MYSSIFFNSDQKTREIKNFYLSNFTHIHNFVQKVFCVSFFFKFFITFIYKYIVDLLPKMFESFPFFKLSVFFSFSIII